MRIDIQRLTAPVTRSVSAAVLLGCLFRILICLAITVISYCPPTDMFSYIETLYSTEIGIFRGPIALRICLEAHHHRLTALLRLYEREIDRGTRMNAPGLGELDL